jgi:hypothetical protein
LGGLILKALNLSLKALIQKFYLNPKWFSSRLLQIAMSHIRLIENDTFFKVSLFFKQALQSWLQFQFHPPEKIEQILQQILWLNSNVLVDKIPVFMGKMFEKGILFINYIVNWNGRVMSMELSELYGKVCTILEYIQLITVLPQNGGGRW